MLQINPYLDDLVADANAGLKDIMGAKATATAVAPGRVNLMGEHIDYCDGFVLPLAIDRYVVIAGTLNDSNEARIATAIGDEMIRFNLDQTVEEAKPKWSNYLRGVVRGFQDRGHKIPGFDAYIISSLPDGAGLASSAAMECAMATLLEGLLDTTLQTREKALLCQKAEHSFVHVPCGIMDQYTSCFGMENRLILIDCRSEVPDLIPFDNPDLTVLIANTMVSHELAEDAYDERRKQTHEGLLALERESWRDVSMEEIKASWNQLGDPINRRARHVVSEIERTVTAAEKLAHNEYEGLSTLMAASHASLRDDFEVSCEELDVMVEITSSIGRSGGVIGTRMTGGGFGGSTVTLCETRKSSQIADTMASEYEKRTGIQPQIFASRPSQGARLV